MMSEEVCIKLEPVEPELCETVFVAVPENIKREFLLEDGAQEEEAGSSAEATCFPDKTAEEMEVVVKEETSEDNLVYQELADVDTGSARNNELLCSEELIMNEEDTELLRCLDNHKLILSPACSFQPVQSEALTSGLKMKSMELKQMDYHETHSPVTTKNNSGLCNSGKPFSCSLCGAKFTDKETLTTHQRMHIGEKPFLCSLCSARFAHKRHLIAHVTRMHTVEKPFSCEVCEKQFSQKALLRRHMWTHTGEKPFSCPLCSAKYVCSSHLKKHIKSHNEMPFSCEVCAIQLSTKSELKRHVMTHMGGRPFSCSFCPSKFTSKKNIVVHMRSHTGEKPFKCTLCPMKFTTKNNLERHTKTHTGEKPFSCNVCAKKFPEKYVLKRHVQIQHSSMCKEML